MISVDRLVMQAASSYRRSLFETIDEVDENITPTQLIATTFRIYGSIFLVCFTTFLLLRTKFPLTYTYNSRVLGQLTPLSKDTYGVVTWIWKIFTYSDDELFEHCGMSAIVYLRFLRLGCMIAAVGIFNSFYLIPVNLLGCNVRNGDAEECVSLVDKVDQISLGHVSSGSPSLLATTFAAYVVFGSAMFLIYREFEWYRTYRHRFGIKPRPDNYSVYVAHIPIEYRSDVALLEYFRSIFPPEDVIEAKVALDIRNLDKKVAARTKVIGNLEHAVNIRDVKECEPTHRTAFGESLDSIPTYSAELTKLNEDISSAISKIEDTKREEEERFMMERVARDVEEKYCVSSVLDDPTFSSALNDSGGPSDRNNEVNEIIDLGIETPMIDKGHKIHGESQSNGSKKNKVFGFQMKTVGKKVGKTVGQVGKTVGQVGKTATKTATKLIIGSEDGKVLDAGFVTFATLLSKNQCRQVLHSETPFTFDVQDAPQPKDVVWSNVGIDHKEQQIGYALAQVLTAATCLLYTIPVTFISSLAQVESLQKIIPGLERAIEKNPWLGALLGQLSPLLLVALTSLLPSILRMFCKREGHVGENDVNASLLSKLSSLMIIQIFFVQAISGSIFKQLQDMLNNPSFGQIIDLLATSVPVQVKAFIQYVQIQNLLGCSIELLRVNRVIMALIRSCMGPNLTDKERNSPWMGILPMIEPEEMDFVPLLAQMVLYFMINLVYSCIAPVMSYFMLLAFGILSLTFRHQLIYTYSAKNDQGGVMWPRMINLLILCIYISEFTLLGILTLKKGAIAAPLLIPLIICTFVFVLYIKQQHFRIAEFVPSTICKATDTVIKGDFDITFLQNQYLQPSLKEKTMFPENFPENEVLEASRGSTDNDD